MVSSLVENARGLKNIAARRGVSLGDSRLVYSSDGSHKQKLPKKEDSAVDPSNYLIRLRLEKQGRGGKTVTVVFDLPENETFCKKLAKDLKKTCGTGGTFKDNRIEIQGDHIEKIGKKLEALGFRWKRSGG